MEKYLLSEDELRTLHQEHRSSKSKREADKIKAVYHLGCGWKIKEVAAALLLDEDTVTSYFRKYISGGVPHLLQDNYSDGTSYLNDGQLSMIDEHFQNNFFETLKQAREYIRQMTHINYCLSGVKRILKSFSYSYRKVIQIPGEPDPVAQAEFIEMYHNLMKNKGKAPVLFADSMHPQHNVVTQRGWIKKHCHWAVNTNTGRKRINIHGALNIENKDVIVLYEESINGCAVVRMLQKLRHIYSQEDIIYLICDNARYYHAAIVKKYLLENPKIKMIFLPPYSPNLNIIERLWKFFNSKVRTVCYEKFDDFKSACESFFENIFMYKNELKTLLTDNFQTFR